MGFLNQFSEVNTGLLFRGGHSIPTLSSVPPLRDLNEGVRKCLPPSSGPAQLLHCSPRTHVVPFSVPFGLDWATASNPAASWASVVVPCSHLRKGSFGESPSGDSAYLSRHFLRQGETGSHWCGHCPLPTRRHPSGLKKPFSPSHSFHTANVYTGWLPGEGDSRASLTVSEVRAHLTLLPPTASVHPLSESPSRPLPFSSTASCPLGSSKQQIQNGVFERPPLYARRVIFLPSQRLGIAHFWKLKQDEGWLCGRVFA